VSTFHPRLQVGSEFRLPPRAMTRERMRWYVDIQDTVQFDDGRIHTQPPTIHDDDDYAKKQGLPGIIADGMISTNWILSLLVDVFGDTVLQRGRLRTKYIDPVYEDQVLITCARVRSMRDHASGDTEYGLEVWCEDDTGKKVTEGEALVYDTRRASSRARSA
jgi:acyl dehydratase